jgi:hypothetical protein
MLFLKEHLINDHYNWSTETSRRAVADSPNRRFFDRLNGNQILYLINFYCYLIDNLTIADGQRIENLIVKELPAELKSEIAAFNWLREQYLYY